MSLTITPIRYSRTLATQIFVLALLIGLVAPASNAQITSQTLFALPQIVVGGDADSGLEFATRILLSNTSDLSEARGVISFANGSGGLLSVRFDDLSGGAQVDSAFPFVVPPSSTVIFEVTSTGPVTAGWALVSTLPTLLTPDSNEAPIGGVASFELRNSFGTTISAAGVGASAFVTRFYVPSMQQAPALRTALAIGNFSPNTVSLSFDLFVSGVLVDSAVRSIFPFGQIALFVDEIFGTPLPAAIQVGQVRVTVTTQGGLAAAIALQFDGLAMRSFPIIADPPAAVSALSTDADGEVSIVDLIESFFSSRAAFK